MLKKKALLLLSVLLATSMLFGCESAEHSSSAPGNTEETPSLSAKTEPFFQTHPFRINADMPEYTLTASMMKNGFKQTTKIVISDAANKEIQSFTPPYNNCFTKKAAYFADVNFDGNLDLLLPNERFAPGVTFNAYLWDADQQQFAECPSFREILNPAPNPSSKQILSKTSSSMVGSYTMYSFRDNRFTATNSFCFDGAGDAANQQIHCAETKGEKSDITVREFDVPAVENGADQNDPQLKPYFVSGSFWDLSNSKWSCALLNEIDPNNYGK